MAEIHNIDGWYYSQSVFCCPGSNPWAFYAFVTPEPYRIQVGVLRLLESLPASVWKGKKDSDWIDIRELRHG